MRSLWFAVLSVFATSAVTAAPALDIDNRVGKFETFYADAMAKPLDADARFALWQKEDGIASVPPGPTGDQMARKLLDDAWSRYPALVPTLSALETDAEKTARALFAKDNEILWARKTPKSIRGSFSMSARSTTTPSPCRRWKAKPRRC